MAHWQELEEIPSSRYHVPVLFFDRVKMSIFAVTPAGLFEYEFDSWTEHNIPNTLPYNFYKDGAPINGSATINPITNTFHFLTTKGSLVSLKMDADEKHKRWIRENKMHGIGQGAQGTVIDNQYHVIGGYNAVGNCKHLKYNEKANNFEVLHDLSDISDLNSIHDHRLMIIKHKILIFGGSNGGNVSLDNIYEYDKLNDEWSILKVKLPKRLESLGCTKILNDKYVVLFGGIDTYYCRHDDIWIYSIRDQTFQKSCIRCPGEDIYQAFTVNNRQRDKKIAFGYARVTWKECNISDHLFPPEYLIRIMHKYYLNEFVHLFDSDDEHWRIDVFDII